MDNIPIVLGQYKISKTLGMGAFGKVKRKITSACFAPTIFKNLMPCALWICLVVAHHIITGLKVAVKILNKGKIKHMEMAEKVRREINILKMCTHPHIIRL